MPRNTGAIPGPTKPSGGPVSVVGPAANAADYFSSNYRDRDVTARAPATQEYEFDPEQGTEGVDFPAATARVPAAAPLMARRINDHYVDVTERNQHGYVSGPITVSYDPKDIPVEGATEVVFPDVRQMGREELTKIVMDSPSVHAFAALAVGDAAGFWSLIDGQTARELTAASESEGFYKSAVDAIMPALMAMPLVVKRHSKKADEWFMRLLRRTGNLPTYAVIPAPIPENVSENGFVRRPDGNYE